MNNKKPSSIEALHKRKIQLQVKSDALTGVLDDNFQYLQDNLGSLLGQATVDAVSSKLPPFVQNLLGKKKETHQTASSPLAMNIHKYGDVIDKGLDMVPFFMKGAKGVIASFLLKQVKNLILK